MSAVCRKPDWTWDRGCWAATIDIKIRCACALIAFSVLTGRGLHAPVAATANPRLAAERDWGEHVRAERAVPDVHIAGDTGNAGLSAERDGEVRTRVLGAVLGRQRGSASGQQ